MRGDHAQKQALLKTYTDGLAELEQRIAEREQALAAQTTATDAKREELKTALEALSERDRKIIFLRYFRDKTQSEVAGMIGVSQVQISRIESRILKDFKERMSTI